MQMKRLRCRGASPFSVKRMVLWTPQARPIVAPPPLAFCHPGKKHMFIRLLGWKVVVTNHNETEAVILSIEEYGAIMQASRDAGSKNEAALDMLRHRFDERLASLQATDAGERLRSSMRGPVKLGGEVKAGESR